MNYDRIVHDIVKNYRSSPIDMLGVGDGEGEYRYLQSNLGSYIRTVRDIDALFGQGISDRRILEVGSFLGPVSLSFKKLGYQVSALDIPEFHESPALRALYERKGIPFTGLNLRSGKLPYDPESFDVVVLCEVMEHLNFNPLPMLREINRVLKQGGYLYIGMPNQAKLANRIKLLMGRSISNPVEHFFNQLDKRSNMVVGLHWREYTMSETVAILGRMGFETVQKYYYADGRRAGEKSLVTWLLKRLSYLYPPFRPYQVVLGRKVQIPEHVFWLTDANS
jgi:SAM-dependent methyltransferase